MLAINDTVKGELLGNESLLSIDDILKGECLGNEVVNVNEWRAKRDHNRPFKNGVIPMAGIVNASKDLFLKYQQNCSIKEPMYRGIALINCRDFKLDPNLGSWYSNLSYASYVATGKSFSFTEVMIPIVIRVHLNPELLNSGEWGDHEELYIPEVYLRDPQARSTLSPVSIGLVKLIEEDKIAEVTWHELPDEILRRKYPVTFSTEKNMKDFFIEKL